MYSKSQFGQVLEELSRGMFDRLVEERGADKHTKGFGSWQQMMAMVFAQLSGSMSLRELEAGLYEHACGHYHLGVGKVKRSTLAEANARRDSGLFKQVCERLLEATHRRLRGELKALLYLLDSSPIDLRGYGYDEWAAAYRSNVSPGLKLHLMIEANASEPVQMALTQARVSDLKHGRQVALETGATYVFDKGYYDYLWWNRIDEAGAVFVTRLKRNAAMCPGASAGG
jgi:hypothetical protein